MATYKTIIPVEVPEIEIRDYTVQRLSDFTGWTDCTKYVGPYATSTGPAVFQDVTEPAVFQDVTEAEEYMNKLRYAHPTVQYRLTRKMIITEVVHA